MSPVQGGERMRGSVTPRGRELMQAIQEAERVLSEIWREPFEHYAPAERLRWSLRQSKAAKVYAALCRQV